MPGWLEIERQDLAKGLRAAFATVVPFFVAWHWHRPELSWLALGGWLASLADPGGTRSRRAAVVLGYGAVGALLVVVGAWLHPHTWLAALAFAMVAFVGSLVRSVGASAASFGTLVTVVTAIATSSGAERPLWAASWFALGALWATVLAAIAWPIWTHLPLRSALATVYAELAGYALDLSERSLRRHHRPIRAALEHTRDVALSLRARRFGESVLGSNLRALQGAAERAFFDLIALGEQLRDHPDTELQSALGELAAMYAEVGTCLGETKLPEPSAQPADPPPPVTQNALVRRMVDAAQEARRIARAPTRAWTAAASLTPLADQAQEQIREGLLELRAACSVRSAYFRHGVRVALTALVALSVGRLVSPEHVTWVSITALAVLQPYPGATLTRALERAFGTVLGCLATAALMLFLREPWQLALAMFPLSVLAIYTKARSYRLFTLFLTPVFVLFVDAGRGDVWTAVIRAADSGLGALIALGAGLFLFPSWEHARIGVATDDVTRRLHDYVLASCAALEAPADAEHRVGLHALRRKLGVALGEAEASLERLLAEPRRNKRGLHRIMQRITLTRRLSAAWTTLDVLRSTQPDGAPLEHEAVEALRQWLLGPHDGSAPPPLEQLPANLHDAFARIARQVELLASREPGEARAA